MATETALEATLNEALNLSNDLLALSDQGEWGEFEHLYRQRDDVLRRLDRQVNEALPMDEALGLRVSAQLEELKTLNNQILRRAEAEKQTLGGQASDARRTRDAVDAYRGR